MLNDQDKIKQVVERCQRQISPYIKDYLNKRGIDDELIKEFQLGYGQFYGSRWITIPVFDVNKNYLLLKLRADPRDKKNKNKYKFYPVGVDVTLYGWDTLLHSEMIVICEGEFDRILLMKYGMPAITSTAGAGTFRKEWAQAFKDCEKVYICFDRDKPGDEGAWKLAQLLLQEIEFIQVFKITLPESVGEGGDITDYFFKVKGAVDNLVDKYAKEVFLDKKEEKLVPVYEGYEGGEITQRDIEAAKSVDCKKFVNISKEGYNGMAFALCPFHNEKEPSFCCYPDDRGYFCYGCGKGGDSINLIMELYSLSFPEAVKFILNQ